MLNNYLIYFYQPSKESGIPNLIPQGRIVLGILTIFGLIKAIGHIIDAVTDPLIASCSDKSKHPDGRRIPLMKKAAIPFGLCALLMFFVPLGKVSGLNAVWIAAFMWGYYFFFTLYMIPHNALIPELIQDGPLRVNAYTVSSFFFVTGSALGYVSPLIVSLFKGTDARRFTDLSDAVIRFAPIDIDDQQYASVHGENENISIDKLPIAVDFYKQLLRNYA